MRVFVSGLSLVFLSIALSAQAPAQAPKLYASAADVTAMMAKAKSTRKPDQANLSQPIVSAAPYSANLEYRVGSNQNASVHEREAEMFYVVDGAATLVTGGKLKDERRTNPENLSGTGIDGGQRQRIAKGDFAMVPENTPHWFDQIEGTLVLMSIHLPHSAK